MNYTLIDKSTRMIIMPTVNEGYAIVFAINRLENVAKNPLLPQSELFVIPFGYNLSLITFSTFLANFKF